MGIVSAVFIEFYESHKPRIQQRHGKEARDWPEPYFFARNIRNWIVHHSGRVIFDNKNDPETVWHQFRFSPKDHKVQAVGANLFYVGELIVLMFELSDALDRDAIAAPKRRTARPAAAVFSQL